MADRNEIVPENTLEAENILEAEQGWTEAGMREWIDGQDYEGLLRWHRFAPPGDPFFAGETGKHYARVMAERRAEEPDGGASASRRIGL